MPAKTKKARTAGAVEDILAQAVRSAQIFKLPNPQEEFGSRDRAAVNASIRKYTDGLVMAARVERYSWWTHWRELADFILPRRYKWLITPNQANRGSPINGHILDSTGTLAARTLASGMMSGVTSPTRPWFKLMVGYIDSTQTSPLSLWLAEVERILMLVFSESNFYTCMAIMYFDLVVFGTATMLIYENDEKVITCHNPCLGEFYLMVDENFRASKFAREFVLTVEQTVKRFGQDNCSAAVVNLFLQGGAQLTKEVIIAHLIEPNDDGRDFGVSANFRAREVYWEWGSPGINTLQVGGFYEPPNIAVRWDLVSNDAYGRGPGMDALPDIKQLQQEVRRKAQAIDKLVNPPMVADMQLKNQPASMLPGGVTYVAGLRNESPGFRPVYQVAPPVKEIMEDLNEVRGRIKSIFFNDILQVISQHEPKSNISATEIDARREEGLVLLGPVLERLQEEGLNNIIDRVFGICLRSGILPPAPPEFEQQPMHIRYVSMLSKSQSAAASSGIERLLQLAGNLVQVDPAVMDNIDIDEAFDEYAFLLGVSPKIIRSPEALKQIRDKREKEKEQQAALQKLQATANVGQTLADTDLGGGQNALAMMSGQAGAGAAPQGAAGGAA